MALRHRNKARFWRHQMRREFGYWNPRMEVFGRIFDEINAEYQRKTAGLLHSLSVTPMNERHIGMILDRRGKSHVRALLNRLSSPPVRTHSDADVIWLEEFSTFPESALGKLPGDLGMIPVLTSAVRLDSI